MTRKTSRFEEGQGKDVSGIVGRHLLYRYENGWRYELYIKNKRTIEYRIHEGIVAGRWVKDQAVCIAHLGAARYTVSWTEPTGSCVSLAIDLDARQLHGAIFFAQWVHAYPERTVCFQNDFLDQMRRYRDEGPTYPIIVLDELAHIHFMEDCGPDNEEVISAPPSALPEGYLDRSN